MNRRHSAFCMVGYAVRFTIIVGLHLNARHHQLPSRELREHRNRVWWTAYILDRSWACMPGEPVSIQDEDIDVDLPSKFLWTSRSTMEDFADTGYYIASLRVANLGVQIAGSIYHISINSSQHITSLLSTSAAYPLWSRRLLRALPSPLSATGEI